MQCDPIGALSCNDTCQRCLRSTGADPGSCLCLSQRQLVAGDHEPAQIDAVRPVLRLHAVKTGLYLVNGEVETSVGNDHGNLPGRDNPVGDSELIRAAL